MADSIASVSNPSTPSAAVQEIAAKLNAGVNLPEVDEHIGALARSERRLTQAYHALLAHAQSLEALVLHYEGELHRVARAKEDLETDLHAAEIKLQDAGFPVAGSVPAEAAPEAPADAGAATT